MYNPLKQRHKHKGFWGAIAQVAGNIGTKFLDHEFDRRTQGRSQDFIEEMSNTAHQREVKDLKAAGLNPILSVNRGAPVMSGGTPSKSSSAPAVSSALMMRQQIEESKAREKLYTAQAAKVGVAQPAYEEGQKVLETVIDKVKAYFSKNANSAQDVGTPLNSKLSTTVPSNSAKTNERWIRSGSPIDKVIKWIQKGNPPQALTTTHSPRSTAYRKALLKVKKLVKGKSPAVQKQAYKYFNKKWKGKK